MIDKSGWSNVKFGDIVKEIKNDVDRNNNPFQNYVAGEHMKSENLHITEYGTFGIDYVGPAFKRIFKRDNVLYGSRRTYLKKIAVAEFDGITSNTTLILETKSEKVLLQRLLPFIMLSDRFTEHSIQESRGSVNPYIVFSDIAKFEFALPPIEEQKRIAELLWAADRDMTTKKDLLLALIQTYKSLINELLFCSGGKSVCMCDMADFNVATIQAKSINPETLIEYIDISSIIKPKHIGDIKKIEFSKAPSRARRIAKSGDILISTVRPNLQSFYQIEQGEYIVSTGFAVASPKSALFGKILYHALFSDVFLLYCENKSIGTNYPAINVQDIKQFCFSINPKVPLEDCVNKLQTVQKAMDDAEQNIFDSESVRSILVNKLFGGAN